MLSYLGTTDFRVVCAKVVGGDPKAVEAYQALVYQLAKGHRCHGRRAVTLRGRHRLHRRHGL